MLTAEARSFSPDLFKFLRELREHNDREWFKANKARYLAQVQEPALEFVRAFAGELRRISPHYVADDRPVGGSLFRIYRDTRFSPDKTPYKTHVGIHFHHETAGRDVHAPVFYLHLEPGDSFVGVGMWRPETDKAKRIRTAIAADSAAWRRATGGKFAATYRWGGESLKRPPTGFDADHPLIDDLKRKDFIGMAPLSQRSITSPGFVKDFATVCRTGVPLVRFLCEAQGVAF